MADIFAVFLGGVYSGAVWLHAGIYSWCIVCMDIHFSAEFICRLSVEFPQIPLVSVVAVVVHVCIGVNIVSVLSGVER
jgi:hypothetical protein